MQDDFETSRLLGTPSASCLIQTKQNAFPSFTWRLVSGEEVSFPDTYFYVRDIIQKLETDGFCQTPLYVTECLHTRGVFCAHVLFTAACTQQRLAVNTISALKVLKNLLNSCKLPEFGVVLDNARRI